MQWFYPALYTRRHVEWKRYALKAYLCWSICVDIAALSGLMWYIFR